MDTQTQYLSPEKHQELEGELRDLKTVQRKEVAERLEYAKSLGDLSENAEYHEARDQQADIEDRIKTIEEILKNATIVSANHGATISVGSTVVVKREDGTQTEYMVVGSEEANLAENKISHQSPIGDALMGKKKGDAVIVATPRGEVKYTIIETK